MNRPEVLNAMNRQLTGELHDAVRAANEDPDIGCIVITGADTHPRVPAFTAGGDIHQQREDQAALNAGTLTREDMDTQSAIRQRGSYEVSASAKPVIGMINGLAYGGGAVLSSSLDIRIGSDAARFRSWRRPTAGSTHLDAGEPGGLAAGQRVAIHGAHCGGRGSVPDRTAEPLGAELPPAQKTMEVATEIATNDVPSVIGIKRLLLQHMGGSLEEQWANEKDFTTNVLRGTLAEEAFPEFLARRGRPVQSA